MLIKAKVASKILFELSFLAQLTTHTLTKFDNIV